MTFELIHAGIRVKEMEAMCPMRIGKCLLEKKDLTHLAKHGKDDPNNEDCQCVVYPAGPKFRSN